MKGADLASPKKLKRELRKAAKAEFRGRLVDTSMESYLEIFARSKKRAVEALIAGHNARIMNISNIPSSIIDQVRASLIGGTVVDKFLYSIDGERARPPSAYLGSWEGHILWANDACYGILRFVSAGHFLAAAMLLRTQLERWTNDIAHDHGLSREKGEETVDFMSRVWVSVKPSGALVEKGDSSSVEEFQLSEFQEESQERLRKDPETLSSLQLGRRKYSPSQVFAELSEFIHARGEFLGLARWEMVDRLKSHPDFATERYSGVISDGIKIILSRLRDRVIEFFPDSKDRESYINFDEELPAGANRFAPNVLWPLNYRAAHDDKVLFYLDRAKNNYHGMMQGKRPAGRLYHDNEVVDLAFLERRFRATYFARVSFAAEKDMMQDDFDPRTLEGREVHYVIVSEFSTLLSEWSDIGSVRDAAVVAASGLRSAYWLWLEDDDRAMALLRIVAEQTARIRTWNLKPNIAIKLEGNPKTTPRDWFEKSGMRRISSFNSALGEMAHARPKIQWPKAHVLLSELQLGSDDPHSIHTARGFALNMATLMLAREVMSTLENIEPNSADMFREVLGEIRFDFDSSLELLEEWFDFVHSKNEKN